MQALFFAQSAQRGHTVTLPTVKYKEEMPVAELQVRDAQYEHNFWLEVERDHAEFLFLEFPPIEQDWIRKTYAYYQEFDQYLKKLPSVAKAGVPAMRTFTMEVYELVQRFTAFQQSLLDQMLACAVNSSTPPTLLDHMVREGQEYLLVMEMLLRGEQITGAALAIHEASLWLPDASGHAAIVRSRIDPSEQEIFESSHQWKTEFDKLVLQLDETKTKLRTGVRWVPALEKLMEMTTANMIQFRQYLLHLEETLEECRALSTLKPKLMEHMARETTYFLAKLEKSRQTE